jgi:hypothetical protein
MAESTKKSSPALVAIAWAVVSIPLAWGIYNTALNAAKLFTPAPAAASAAAPSAAK